MYASLTLLNLQYDVHVHVHGHVRVHAGAERGSYSVDSLIPFNLRVQRACYVCVRHLMYLCNMHARMYHLAISLASLLTSGWSFLASFKYADLISSPGAITKSFHIIFNDAALISPLLLLLLSHDESVRLCMMSSYPTSFLFDFV